MILDTDQRSYSGRPSSPHRWGNDNLTSATGRRVVRAPGRPPPRAITPVKLVEDPKPGNSAVSLTLSVLSPSLRAKAISDIGGTVESARGTWSDAARSVWGKTDRDSPDGEWLPLVQHLEDSAAVAGALWDHWLAPNVRRLIGDGLPDPEADGRRLFSWLAGVHDIGKATPGFAVKALHAPGFEHLVERMAAHGLACPPHTRGGGEMLPPHCRLGQFVLQEWLSERHGVRGNAAQAFAVAVGAHHGTPPSSMELQNLHGSRWTGRREEPWRAIQFEILNALARWTGVEDRLRYWASTPPPPPAQALLSAAVVVADWLASDAVRFPYGEIHSAEERLDGARLDDDLLGPWNAETGCRSPEDLLASRFPQLAGRRIRPIQAALLDVVTELETPSLVVLEAPMGCGKTEAALLAAEKLAARFGCGGVFVALPTMATSDAMFTRVLDWTAHLEPDAPQSIFLAHGKARLNDNYRVVARRSTRAVSINEAEGDPRGETAVVTTWLQGRRKGLLANMVVGTIDQALIGALKARHVALRHLALAGKVVIIDEVHAADAYMRRYLVRVLEWLGAYGTPIILMSATLPPAHRRELVNAYARGRDVGPAEEQRNDGYPAITVQGDRLRRKVAAWTDPPTQLRMRLLPDGEMDLVRELVEDGACVVVVRNTVGRAQQTYRGLVDVIDESRVTLLHSRLVAAERARRERDLLGRLGPPSRDVDRPRGYVVVGTQVLEQSLDIDADVMITDVAPVDLLLQRAGRLHRHLRGPGQSQRPAGTREARLHITGVVTGQAGPPNFDSGAEAVYGRSALLRSMAVLAPHLGGEPITMPNDIPRIVASAYDPGIVPPMEWEQVWTEAEQSASHLIASQVDRAQAFRLGEPFAQRTLVGWLDGRTSEVDEASTASAQVRDSEASLEVLVVWRDTEGVLRLLPGPHEHANAELGIPSNGPPSERLALAVLDQSLRLPAWSTRGSLLDKVICELETAGRDFDGWQQSTWLRGQLILCLDADFRATVGGRVLHYDHDLGLVLL